MTNMPSTNPYESTSESPPESASSAALADDSSKSPNILKDRSFWGLAITQFFGAFNDNLYKQLMLLLAIPAIGANISEDTQGWATTVFSLPFVLLSSLAGYLSDRHSKSRIIVLCKMAEIAITLLAVVAFLSYAQLGDVGTWTVLVLMGVHSTFFGPSKYGILPELFRKEELPRANGLILMSTFLAIILGVVTAGLLKDLLVVKNADGTADYHNLWIGSLVCTGIAVIGAITSLMIRSTPPAQPTAELSFSDLGLPAPIRKLLSKDKSLSFAIVVSSMFYVVAGVVMPTVNSLGKLQLMLASSTAISILTGGLAIGIIIGAVLGNIVFKRMAPSRQVHLGTWGMIVSLMALGCWKAGGDHLLGYWGALLGLVTTGLAAAVFIIPLQVFVQKRPPSELKGRMIGTMNFANFVGILIAGPLYQGFLNAASSLHWPVSSIFWMLAGLLVPIALVYRLPKTES